MSGENLSDFSPGRGSLDSLGFELGDLSIDNTSSPLSSPRSESDNYILPDISNCDSNISIAYSVSFEELQVEPAAYNLNSKRKLKKAPKLSVDSPKNSGYSPLATNILNVKNSALKQKRFSEFFRAELSNLNLSTHDSPAFSDGDSFKNLSLNSDKEENCENLSLDADKENLSNLSIDEKTSTSSKVLSSSRYSEHFRSEASQLHLSSPDISFDLPESPKNSDLSLVMTGSSRENSLNKEVSKKASAQDISCHKPRSFSEHFRHEVSELHLSSPDISFDLSKSPKSKDLSLQLTESSRENSISKPDMEKPEIIRVKKGSDEDCLNLITPSRRGVRANILDSSDEEEADVSTLSDDEKVKSFPLRNASDNNLSSEDEKYDSSFIDDEALEGEETASDDESDVEYVPTDESSDSACDDANRKVKTAHTSTSSSDDDEFITPSSVVEETPYVTPRTQKDTKKFNPTNLYKTPSTFCHSPKTPASKNDRLVGDVF